jgi:ABC-2 type transport system ATP-binding protein
VLSLLGPNGSGKTTTLKLISTLLLPDRGNVCVNGLETRSNDSAVRQQVGFALATERSFFPRLTVRENLEFFATLENVFGRQRSTRIAEVLEQVGIDAHSNKQVMKLSTGLHQRLAIARALVKRPSVLLLDEPSRSLDPAGASRLWALIRQLAFSGMTIILATHNFAEAHAVSDRVAVLQKGVLAGICDTNCLTLEQLERQYLQFTGEKTGQGWPEEIPA